MLSRIQQTYANAVLKPYLLWYLKKERRTTFRGFELTIRPTVFHPKYFFSSGFLFDFVSTLNLDSKRFFEIGCGSGLISLQAYQKKALVTTCDINDSAVECTKENFARNFGAQLTEVTVVKSDLFDSLPDAKFDTIVINPPYFFSEVRTDDQLSWNCGKNGEYFVKLFSGLKIFIHAQSEVYMVLADNCEIDRIKNIAKSNQFLFELIVQKKIKWETNFIFKIKAI